MMDMSPNPEFTLTSDQQAASDAFFKFLMEKQVFFNVSGTAGTGKTFLMGWLSTKVMDTYHGACALMNVEPEYDTIHYTATTNKAAEVLEHSLGRPVTTIHSFMGLAVKKDFRTGKSYITRTRKWRVIHNAIIFIDECSMIDKQLYREILETFVNCKIVYVGDHAQMAPVGEKISMIYQDIAEENFVVLKQPVRNAGTPALVRLCSQLRDSVETGIFHPIEPVPGVIEYLSDTMMERKLHEEFVHSDPSCRVLTYTNERVMEFNQFIRQDVRGKSSEPTVGDVFVVASAAQLPNGMTLQVEREVTILGVGPIQEDHTYDEVLGPGHTLQFRVVDLQINTRGLSEEVAVKLPVNFAYVTYLKKHFAKLKEWATFFEIEDSYADLRDKAACTVYKSQGSTYESVFVDLGNIGNSFDPDQVARMLFVAVSRAKKRVYLYGSLPHRYCHPPKA